MNNRVTWLGVGLWMLLTLVGMLFAGGFHFPGGYGLPRWSPAEMEFSSGMLGFIFGAISGLFIAGAQSLLLRAWGGPVRAWLLFNALGYGLVHALADAVPYRPITTYGGGIIVAVCQYLALRASLTRPLWWLPVTAVAWWLAFGLTEGPQDYNHWVVVLVLGATSGLALRFLLIPAAKPGPIQWWARLKRPGRVVVTIGAVIGIVLFLILFAGLSGLTGMFVP
jgi:hypothetical protein